MTEPVRRDDATVRQQLARVLEEHDAVAEQDPALVVVLGDDHCGITIRRFRGRALTVVSAHRDPPSELHQVGRTADAAPDSDSFS